MATSPLLSLLGASGSTGPQVSSDSLVARYKRLTTLSPNQADPNQTKKVSALEAQVAIDTFKRRMGTFSAIPDDRATSKVANDPATWRYYLNAYGFGSAAADGLSLKPSEIQALLKSDQNSISSTMYKFQDGKYISVVRGFQRELQKAEVERLINDPTLMDMLFRAYGSVDAVNDYKNLGPLALRQILTSNPADPKSIGNVYGGGKYKSIVAALNIANGGMEKFALASFQTTTITKYRAAVGVDAPPPAARTVQDDEIDKFAKRPDIARLLAEFKDGIGKIKTVDDFFANPKMLKVALTAFGLESEAQYVGKIRQILKSNLADVNSLANRFQDNRYREMAKAFDFAAQGIAKLSDKNFIDGVAKKYLRNAFEIDLNQTYPGMRAALTFQRDASSVKSNVDILANNVMRNVVSVAYNIPKEIARQSQERQAEVVGNRVDVKHLNDKAYVDKIIVRYFNNGTGGQTSRLNPSLVNLLS